MNDELENLQRELEMLKKRNQRVEAEKAWETSMCRIGSIALVTFVTASLALYAVGNDHPWRNALIPVIGFILSMQSLPFLRKWWLRRYIER